MNPTSPQSESSHPARRSIPARPQPAPLALARFAQGLTQAQLAELAGLTRETVCKVERGHHPPSLATALAVARVLGYSDPALLFPEAFTP